jgi:putative chitinase
MDYKQAADVRKKGFANLMTDKLLSGEGIGSSLKNTISERTKAKVTGIKETFDPLNIAKKITGGSRLGPALMGKMLGRSAEDIKHFTGDEIQNEEKSSSEKVLGQIYDLMIKKREEELKKRGIERNLKEEIDAETEKRDKELIKTITGEKKVEKKRVSKKAEKPEKPSKLKAAAKKTLNIGASAGLLFAAGSRPAEPEEKKDEVEPSVEEKPKKVPSPEPVSKAETSIPTATPTEPISKPKTKSEPIKRPPSPGFQAGKKEILQAMDKEGIKNPEARAQILAQTAHESASFKYTQELGNAQYFQKYEGRKDLGNVNPGDGLKYIGRGFLQTTGRVNYQQFADAFNVDVVNNPEKLAEPRYAADSALFWFKKNAKKVEKLSGGDWSNTKGVTKAVNGGYNGLDDRIKYYEMFKQDPEVTGVSASIQNSAPTLSTASIQNSAPTSSTVTTSSQQNKDLKDSLKKDQPTTVAKNTNITNINQTQTAATPDKTDDRSAYLKKSQAA